MITNNHQCANKPGIYIQIIGISILAIAYTIIYVIKSMTYKLLLIRIIVIMLNNTAHTIIFLQSTFGGVPSPLTYIPLTQNFCDFW